MVRPASFCQSILQKNTGFCGHNGRNVGACLYNKIILMNHLKLDSPRSVMETEACTTPTLEGTPMKECPRRFRRTSHSSSRSQSRDSKEGFKPVYIRELTSTHPENYQTPPRGQWRNEDQRTVRIERKRKDSPARPRKEFVVQQPCNVERELEVLRLEKKLHQSSLENQRLKAINTSLQQKLEQAQQSLAMANQELLNKNPQKKPKGSLNRLKQAMQEQRDVEEPSEAIKLRSAQAEVGYLRQKLRVREEEVRELESKAWKMADQREQFMSDLVQQLRQEVALKEKHISQMDIRLGMLLVREQKRPDQEAEALSVMKKKYGRLLRQYSQATRELAAEKRRHQRMELFTSPRDEILTRDGSLSLSP